MPIDSFLKEVYNTTKSIVIIGIESAGSGNGIIAFVIAVVWIKIDEKGEAVRKKVKVSPLEIWTCLPKFILGFVLTSLVFTFALPDDEYTPPPQSTDSVTFSLPWPL